MKTKKLLGVALLLILTAAGGYWLGYRHRNSPTYLRLKVASSQRQSALAFRQRRNDLLAPFSVTGSIAAPKSQAQG
jgi:hypothetical protein